MVLAALGAVATVPAVIRIGSSEDMVSFLFTLGIACFNASPFAALFAMAYRIRHGGWSDVLILGATVIEAACVIWSFLAFHRANDPAAGVIFIVMPAVALAGVAIVYAICSELKPSASSAPPR